MRLKEFANKYELSLESLHYLIHDFGIDLNFCFTDKFVVSPAFENFVIKHLDFIRKYAADKALLKTLPMIAETIQMDQEKVAAFFLQNGVQPEDLSKIKTNISSYLIDLMLGGDYEFIFQDIPGHRYGTNDQVGYSDLFFYNLDMLEPFINQDQIRLWGISKPAGIVLYGPPGSGKIYWAKRIGDMIGYEFVHVFKDYLLNTARTDTQQFHQFLQQQMEKTKTLLFIENFEELWDRDNKTYASPQAMELINTIFRYIQKDVKREIVIVGSVEVLSRLNDEITAPGRFDLHIPIFLPSAEERAQLIHYHLTHNLEENSPLLAILNENKANSPQFWSQLTAEMKLFSNTMLIDFTQSLKKRLYAIYRRKNQEAIPITSQILIACLNEVKAKLTKDYLTRCHIFIQEAKQNVALEFPQRFLELEYELDAYTEKKEPIPKIGFETNAERSKSESAPAR